MLKKISLFYYADKSRLAGEFNIFMLQLQHNLVSRLHMDNSRREDAMSETSSLSSDSCGRNTQGAVMVSHFTSVRTNCVYKTLLVPHNKCPLVLLICRHVRNAIDWCEILSMGKLIIIKESILQIRLNSSQCKLIYPEFLDLVLPMKWFMCIAGRFSYS